MRKLKRRKPYEYEKDYIIRNILLDTLCLSVKKYDEIEKRKNKSMKCGIGGEKYVF